ncbi:MAG: dTMP kinase [Candidatus Omnitrophica bacterium]|nr:dTMP kinase [Candidatus Omnitrophota bacterium]MDD5311029.1 dTMP kinase [Candidatus Omnitrophota bacterium]MDD5546547.1 dTMP kinase [Candidatus Omnitrophota bacterium]
MRRGKFITIEGPEGSGKSTHSRLLCARLKKGGLRVLHTREPGGTKIGEAVRKLLLDKKNKKMSAACELFLFLAARAQIVEEIIRPALAKGYIVVCDRFHDATVAYQGYGAGLGLKLIDSAGRLATGGLKPDLTILLDVETKTGLKRAGVKDRMEIKPVRFHKKVRDGYLKIAKREPRRIKVIRTTDAPVTAVQDKIRRAVLHVI